MTSLPTGLASLFLGAALLFGLAACQPDTEAGAGADDEATDAPASDPHVIEITAVDYAFAAPDSIPAGWVTFRMRNRGTESHHFHLDRLPEGRTFADWQEAFKEPADSIMQLVAKGTIDPAETQSAIDRATPDWAGNLQTRGGVGLVAPGRTGQTTHFVEPGHYVMICVIDAPNGRIHASLGMVDGLVAVESSGEHSPPEPSATVRSARREIRTDGKLTSGMQTVGFRAQEVPEGLRGGTDGYYSVWLARLNDTTDVRDVATWDYQNPAPYESLGGFEYLPPDQAAYVTADLTPSRYAWIWFYEGMDLSGDDEPLVKAFTVE